MNYGILVVVLLIAVMAGGKLNELVSTSVYRSNYEVILAEVKEEQCNIDKPSGTICEYVGTWVAKPVEDKENK